MKRRIKRPKNRWLNAIESDMRTVGMCINYMKNRVKWSFRTWMADPNS